MWMNDPNGLIHWRGQYHMFYQYNPDRVGFGAMRWGHAVSDDLAHWQHLPVALSPTLGGPDKDGVYSGSAVDDHGRPTLIYTGISPECQCIATSDDDLVTWQKYAGNPVIPAPPAGLAVTGFRDPYVWREDNGWSMVLGSGIRGQGGAVLLYHSSDLTEWTYRGPLMAGDQESEETWECPSLFPLGDRHVLLYSVFPFTYAWVGQYAQGSFTPEQRVYADWGGEFYAAQPFQDASGRRLLFGWVFDRRSDAAREQAGWAGLMSLPRVLTMRDGQLGVSAAPELASLHEEAYEVGAFDIGEFTLLPEVCWHDTQELQAEIDLGAAQTVSLIIRRSPDGEEYTELRYDRASGQLQWLPECSSLDPDVERIPREAPLTLEPDEPLRLQVFLDRSVVEVFANGQVSLTGRIYPTRRDSQRVAFASEGAGARLNSLQAWRMQSAGVF
jgi:beta-fructofuranosidase